MSRFLQTSPLNAHINVHLSVSRRIKLLALTGGKQSLSLNCLKLSQIWNGERRNGCRSIILGTTTWHLSLLRSNPKSWLKASIQRRQQLVKKDTSAGAFFSAVTHLECTYSWRKTCGGDYYKNASTNEPIHLEPASVREPKQLTRYSLSLQTRHCHGITWLHDKFDDVHQWHLYQQGHLRSDGWPNTSPKVSVYSHTLLAPTRHRKEVIPSGLVPPSGFEIKAILASTPPSWNIAIFHDRSPQICDMHMKNNKVALLQARLKYIRAEVWERRYRHSLIWLDVMPTLPTLFGMLLVGISQLTPHPAFSLS